MCIYVYFYVNRFGDKDVVCGFEIEVLDHNLNKFHVNLYKHYVILFKNILNNKGLEYFRTESNVKQIHFDLGHPYNRNISKPNIKYILGNKI